MANTPQDIAKFILVNSEVFDLGPGTVNESLRVYNSNWSDLGNTLASLQTGFWKRIELPVKLIEEGKPLPDQQALDVIRFFCMFLSDVSIAVTKEQRERLSRGKFTIPTMLVILNIENTSELVKDVKKFVDAEAKNGEPAMASAKTYMDAFIERAKEDRDNMGGAVERRKEVKRERAASSQPPPTAPDDQAAIASLQQEPSVEEQAAEANWVEIVETGYTYKFVFTKYGWWILGGVATILLIRAMRNRRK